MLKVLDPQGIADFEIKFITDEPFLLHENRTIQAECCISGTGGTHGVVTLLNRQDLRKFSLNLETMHKDLIPGSEASLWSAHGNLALRVFMADKGMVTFNCILSDLERNSMKGLFAQIVIDQSYLPGLSEQTNELSKTTTPWSN